MSHVKHSSPVFRHPKRRQAPKWAVPTRILLLTIIAFVNSNIAFAAEKKARILDYFYPLTWPAKWKYLEQEGSGDIKAAQVSCAPGQGLTIFDIRNGRVVPIYLKAARLIHSKGSYLNGEFNIRENFSVYSEFYGSGDSYRIHGIESSRPEQYSIRFGPEAIFPEKIMVPGSISRESQLFNYDGQKGPKATLTMEVLAKESVTVPAGTFKDCLHLRFSLEFKGGPSSSSDEWWAKGVGVVKSKKRNEDGSTTLRRLHSYEIDYGKTLQLLQDVYSFGPVRFPSIYNPGVSTKSAAVYFTNTGPITIKEVGIELTGSPAFKIESTFTGELLPGATGQIIVSFSPGFNALFAARLKVTDLERPTNYSTTRLEGSGVW